MTILGYGLALLLTLIATTAVAQTITTGPLDRTIYCADDSITVDYTVTGSFAPGNVFLLQMSDTADDFKENFFNLGTVTATGSGSIRGKLPFDTEKERGRWMEHARFRFRVVGSNPVVLGSDNGADIELVEPNAVSASFPLYGVAGTPLEFTADLHRATGHAWDFGPGANPRLVFGGGGDGVEVSSTTFDSPGTKNVIVNGTSEGGCSNWMQREITILSPIVTIPGSVTIVQSETTVTQLSPGAHHFWICPGGTLSLRNYHNDSDIDDTVVVYAEFGATLLLDDYVGYRLHIYARNGSVVTGEGIERYGVIMYEEGASVPLGPLANGARITAATLTFDYSNVPPGGCPSLAPYTVEIKPSSNGIHTESNESGSDEHYRVYGDGDLTITGDRNTYYLDAGARLALRGSDGTIYAKNGATVDVMEGSNNRIIYELDATLENTGDAAILLPSSGITFVGDISGVNESGATNGALVRVVPNPARDDARIIVDAELGRLVSIELYVLATGERLMRIDDTRVEARLDLRGLPSGLYGVRVIAEKGEVVKTLRVEAGE